MDGAHHGSLRERTLVVVCGVLCTLVVAAIYLPLLPSEGGRLGHDYSYFLPQLLAGSYWMHENGPLAVPWFTPAWLGGVPFYPNPQNLYHSVPQQLCAVLDPVSAVRATFVLFVAVGFSGTYRLMRGAFGASRPAAVFGAVLFACNGYYAHRMLIGHVVYHAFMVVPWIGFWLTRPRTRTPWREARLGVLAGVGLAYMFQSADLYGLPVAVGTVAAVALLQRLDGRAVALLATRAAVAGTVAISLCAAKLVAMAALLAAFPRTGYALPGARDVWSALGLAAEAVFWAAPVHQASTALVNAPWAIQQHELEYGISPVAGIAIVVGAATLIWRGARPRAAAVAGLVALLLVPIALNVHAPAWEAFLKQVPLLGSSSNLVRTFTLYLLPGCLGAALVIDRCLGSRPLRIAAAGVCALLALGWHASIDRSYYEEQRYDPGRVVAAWRTMHETGEVPAIARFVTQRDTAGHVTMTVGRNDALTDGASQLAAFEPVFGYRLEWFPFRDVREGAAIQEVGAQLNVKHPARFIYPDANGGAPGTAFPLAARADVEHFLAYRPFPFAVPWRQRLANVLSVLALGAVVVVLVGDAWKRSHSRR